MQQRYVLVFDVGTQGTRAMVIDSLGNIVVKHKISYTEPYIQGNNGFAEQDPDFYFKHICTAAKQVQAQAPSIFEKVEAVSLTTIRDTAICIDQNGKPLRNAILWLDQRRATGNATMPLHRQWLLKAIGMEETVNLQYQKSHCNWIREFEPEIWKNTHKYILLSTYLIYKFTGKLVDSVASTVFHGPFDFKRRTWQHKSALIYPVFPIEKEKLYPLVESGAVLGVISAQMQALSGVPQGLPLIAAGSDKACEVIGLGCLAETSLAAGLGTTATLTYNSTRYVEPHRFMPAYCSILPNCWNPEMEVYRGYWLISWFKKEFAKHEALIAEQQGISTEQVLDQTLQSIPPGCDGLLFAPYLTPNINMPNAKGAIVGFSDIHTRLHIYRAIIEGINFVLLEGMQALQKNTGLQFQEIRIGGGGSNSDEICQITANMFGLPVVRTTQYEVAGMGAAITAFVSLGAFESFADAIGAMVHIAKTFTPDPKQHAFYQKLLKNVFHNIFPSLAPLYAQLQTILKEG